MSLCLVVDDSRVIRKIAVKMLSDLNIQTREAGDGAEALEMCAERMPDLVMLDWNMPVLDGLGFLKRLRSMDADSQPKVLFCTTETDFARIAQALAEGADEYIMKPFDGEILQSKLKLIGVI